jgi:hypothetical protein
VTGSFGRSLIFGYALCSRRTANELLLGFEHPVFRRRGIDELIIIRLIIEQGAQLVLRVLISDNALGLVAAGTSL